MPIGRSGSIHCQEVSFRRPGTDASPLLSVLRFRAQFLCISIHSASEAQQRFWNLILDGLRTSGPMDAFSFLSVPAGGGVFPPVFDTRLQSHTARVSQDRADVEKSASRPHNHLSSSHSVGCRVVGMDGPAIHPNTDRTNYYSVLVTL